MYSGAGIFPRTTYMDLDLPKMFPEFFLFLWGEILVSEEDDRSLCNEKSQFIFLLVCQVLQLKTHNLRADVRSQIYDFLGRRE